MNNTTDQRLREIAERENKATKGPWEVSGYAIPNELSVCDRDFIVAASVTNDLSKNPNRQREWQIGNLEFIARSRQDVPWLLALIKKQREALEADALADKLFERAEAHREESIACGYDNDPTGSLAVTESYKAANAQALIATQLKRDALNFSPENL